MVLTRFLRLGYGQECLPEYVQRDGLAVSIADLAAQGEGSLAAGDCFPVVMLPQVNLGTGGQNMCLDGPVAGFQAEDQGPLNVAARLPVMASSQVRDTEVIKGQELAGLVSGFLLKD